MVVNNLSEVKALVEGAEAVYLVATLRQVATDTIRVGKVSAATWARTVSVTSDRHLLETVAAVEVAESV